MSFISAHAGWAIYTLGATSLAAAAVLAWLLVLLLVACGGGEVAVAACGGGGEVAVASAHSSPTNSAVWMRGCPIGQKDKSARAARELSRYPIDGEEEVCGEV